MNDRIPDNPLADADRVRESAHNLIDSAHSITQILCERLDDIDELPALRAVSELLKQAEDKLCQLESHLMAAQGSPPAPAS